MEGLSSDIFSDPALDGKYRFERHVASSAMAVVVIARHLELDEKVAVKFLSPDALRSNAAVSRFRREARAAAKIKNQHVVRIIDVSTTESGIPYMVMEFLDGQDLERLIAKYPGRQAPIGDAIDFILQASEAVIEGHALGIVHRDLKPANLFCVDRGDGYPMIKVLDFGISKFTTAPSGDVERTDQHEILGSPRYMSPEQITSAWSVDQRSDVWSLGVILYEAIAGVPPFKEDIIPELWRKIRLEDPPALTELRPDCPEELSEVIFKCLEKDPAKRYGDLSALARDLAPFALDRSRGSIARIRWTVDSSNDVSTRPSTYSDSYDRPLTSRTKRRRQRWLYTGIAAAVVGLMVGVAITKQGRVNARSLAAPSPQPGPESLKPSNLEPRADEPQVIPTTLPVPSAPPVVVQAPPPARPTTTPQEKPVVRNEAAPTTSAEPRWLVPPIDSRK